MNLYLSQTKTKNKKNKAFGVSNHYTRFLLLGEQRVVVMANEDITNAVKAYEKSSQVPHVLVFDTDE